jgi:hypothetical protein
MIGLNHSRLETTQCIQYANTSQEASHALWLSFSSHLQQVEAVCGARRLQPMHVPKNSSRYASHHGKKRAAVYFASVRTKGKGTRVDAINVPIPRKLEVFVRIGPEQEECSLYWEWAEDSSVSLAPVLTIQFGRSCRPLM